MRVASSFLYEKELQQTYFAPSPDTASMCSRKIVRSKQALSSAASSDSFFLVQHQALCQDRCNYGIKHCVEIVVITSVDFGTLAAHLKVGISCQPTHEDDAGYIGGFGSL